MFLTSIKRVAKQGFVSFWRNGLVSFTSIFVLAVTLFIIGSVVMGNAFLQSSLRELEDKVDVNVYFITTANEADILALRGDIEALPEVKIVEYFNKEEALARFVERSKGNTLVLQSLEELGDNPLGAVFNIRANSPSEYAGIVSYLESSSASNIIDRINYADNQGIIDKLGALIAGLTRLGTFVSLVLVAMSVLVTFSTIRLAIYNAKQEISVMRLVGAGNSFIRGPFVIEGVMYGIFAAILALVALYPGTRFVTENTQALFGGIDMLEFYATHFSQIFTILMASGIILGMFSSFVAVRRYLKA